MSGRTSSTVSPLSWTSPRVRRGVIELGFLAVLYVAYSASRLLASADVGPARDRARDLLTIERVLQIDHEAGLVDLFVRHEWLGLLASYWYATTHYVVTAVVLVWLYRRSATHYVTARRVLVLATLLGLCFYLTMPTAPPRLLGPPYEDVLALTATDGWWAADASAPQGLGHLTNELAAFPSLHAGWSLWVAVVLSRAGVPRLVSTAGFGYAGLMALDVVGTANHWVLDVLVGWFLVLAALVIVLAWERRSPVIAHEDRGRG